MVASGDSGREALDSVLEPVMTHLDGLIVGGSRDGASEGLRVRLPISLVALDLGCEFVGVAAVGGGMLTVEVRGDGGDHERDHQAENGPGTRHRILPVVGLRRRAVNAGAPAVV